MTIQEAYDRFLLKVDRNYKSSNVITSKDRFVIIYNEEQIRRIEECIGNKNNDKLREIFHFLKTEENLPVIQIQDNKFSLQLPSDYLDLSSAYCYVSTDSCEDIRLSLFEIKDYNTEEILKDVNNQPSIKYREAPFYVGGDSLQIFSEGFTIDRATVSYYRYPKPVDIEGYEHRDGTASTNIDPQGDDAFINKVISMAAESYFRNYQDMSGIQINKERVINNN